MRVIGVGDNTVDKYIHLGQMFPGGNAVNVAVLARRYGHQASYLGWLGDDAYGRLLLDALKQEQVDTSHCRVVAGENAHCEVNLINNDRVFGAGTHGVTTQMALTQDDLDYIAGHDVTHTSIYSHIENDLPALGKAAPLLSFDYSQNWTETYLEQTLPHVDIAILSHPERPAHEVHSLMRWITARGPRIVLITQGKDGAHVLSGGMRYHQPIVEANVVDTLGAGDAFAARFLVEHLSGTPSQQALFLAARSAAETCGYYGAFGHGAPIINS